MTVGQRSNLQRWFSRPHWAPFIGVFVVAQQVEEQVAELERVVSERSVIAALTEELHIRDQKEEERRLRLGSVGGFGILTFVILQYWKQGVDLEGAANRWPSQERKVGHHGVGLHLIAGVEDLRFMPAGDCIQADYDLPCCHAGPQVQLKAHMATMRT